MSNLLLWAFLGSGIGGGSRFLISGLFENPNGTGFPRGTFLVNVLGSLAIGALWALSEKTKVLSPSASVFLMSGICGGFTTFSAFSLENMKLLQAGEYAMAGIYTLGSVLGGLIALWAGVSLMKLIS